ncbi:hypothetical protein EIP91_010039 [Steccherinum ochraceum]|uniref:Uncharacterized protein n=1 Tax=Steccherinum ochraceum TaxID=92696 RepID=A0A4R0R3K7_9APHY|nr:hypothetical protein EIP91_010039 [Steccherinum ochraceum]
MDLLSAQGTVTGNGTQLTLTATVSDTCTYTFTSTNLTPPLPHAIDSGDNTAAVLYSSEEKDFAAQPQTLHCVDANGLFQINVGEVMVSVAIQIGSEGEGEGVLQKWEGSGVWTKGEAKQETETES